MTNTASESDELPQLGRYQVINKIAAGGMAEVFLAKAVGAMGFQRLVAVKLIHANFTRDEEFVKMFIDEARIAMHLHHRNIVQVFDLDKIGDTYFIAMEFVHGVNLYDLYERIASQNRWIDPPMSLYLVAEVSKGLHFAHTRTGPDGRPLGIIHRDISPQNVLMSFEGEIKITDFGIATAAERLHQTAAGIVKGKYAYMAPERLQENPVDARVDVFSVGVLLYELLVGENPFAGTSAVDTIENVLNKEVIPPSERGAPVSKRLDDICLRALAKNPEERYESGLALADAVTEYAMELTHARKDMAAGDSAVAILLAELFPEKATAPAAQKSSGKIDLPGVSAGGGIQVATIEPDSQATPADPASTEDLIQTHDDLPDDKSRGGPNIEETEDFDAPTVLRMSPMTDDPAMPEIAGGEDEDIRTAPEALGLISDSSYTTLPPVSDGPPTTPNPDMPDDWGMQSLETPQTPVESDGMDDNTAPTEVPMYESVDQTIRSEPVSFNGGAGPADPAQSDPYAQTIQRGEAPPEVMVSEPSPQEYAGPAPHAIAPIQSPSLTPTGSQAVSGSNPALDPSEVQPLVVPVAQDPSSMSNLTAAPRKPGSKMNLIAGAFLAAAALVVVAAFLVVKFRDETPIFAEIPLRIITQPPGAEVLIDGQQSGVTPYEGTVRSNQGYLITLKLDGHDTHDRRIKPQEGIPELLIDHSMIRKTGSMRISPNPAEAKVYINGELKGTGSVSVKDLPLNTPLRVQIELRGHKTYDQTYTLTESERNQTLAISLSRGRSTKVVP